MNENWVPGSINNFHLLSNKHRAVSKACWVKPGLHECLSCVWHLLSMRCCSKTGSISSALYGSLLLLCKWCFSRFHFFNDNLLQYLHSDNGWPTVINLTTIMGAFVLYCLHTVCSLIRTDRDLTHAQSSHSSVGAARVTKCSLNGCCYWKLASEAGRLSCLFSGMFLCKFKYI